MMYLKMMAVVEAFVRAINAILTVDTGQLLRIPGEISRTSFEKVLDGDEPAFQRPSDMPKSEIPVLIDFLQEMLVLDPEKRKSAAQMVEHEWLKEEGGGSENK